MLFDFEKMGRALLFPEVLELYNLHYKISGEKGLCSCPSPSHVDEHPSTIFKVGGDWGLHCLGCGKSWNGITFVQEMEGCSAYEAAKIIYEHYRCSEWILEGEDNFVDSDDDSFFLTEYEAGIIGLQTYIKTFPDFRKKWTVSTYVGIPTGDCYGYAKEGCSPIIGEIHSDVKKIHVTNGDIEEELKDLIKRLTDKRLLELGSISPTNKKEEMAKNIAKKVCYGIQKKINA